MQQNPAPWQCCSNPDFMAKLSSQALGAAHLHRYLQRRHLSHKASELQLQGRKIYYKQKSWPPPATSITHTGMTSMFFPMINSGLWETLLTFIPFFFPMDTGEGWTADTREQQKNSRILVLKSAQQFVFSDSKASLLQMPTENWTAVNSGIWESSKNLELSS